jgi:hypothetical protein
MASRRLPLIALAALISLSLAPPAAAAEIVSQYTSADIDTKTCKKIAGEEIDGSELYSTYSCRGVAGYIALMLFEDARNSVSAGRSVKAAENEPAASEGFLPFNSALTTIEWRGEKGKKPFAIIQRWSIADLENAGKDGRPGSAQLLVVTRLPPGPVCQVALIDVKANGGEANAVARKAADEIARGFTCGKDEAKFIGAQGRASQLAARPQHVPEEKK